MHRHEDLAIFDRAFDAFWRESRQSVRAAGPDGRTGDTRTTTPRLEASGQRCSEPADSPPATSRCPTDEAAAAHPADVERRGDAGTQGLRGVHGRGDGAGARRARAARVEPGRAPHAPVGARPRARASTCGVRWRQSLRTGGDVVIAAARGAADAAAPAGPALRRQRLDGALLAHAAALRARASAGATAASRRSCSRPA